VNKLALKEMRSTFKENYEVMGLELIQLPIRVTFCDEWKK